MASKAGSLPLYQQIYEKLIEEVRDGRLKPGNRVPSENELSKRFGVSRITTKRVLEMLSDEGLVERVPGKGTFLREKGSSGAVGGGLALSGRLIGLVLPGFADEFGATLIGAIESSCRQLGYQLVLSLTYESQKLEEEEIQKLLDLGVSGLIVQPVHGEFYNSIMLKLVLDKFPLVFVDRKLKGLEASTVSTDNMDAAKVATDYLLDAGHRVVSFISRRMANTSTLEARLEGFFRSHAERGVVIDPVIQVLELPTPRRRGLDGVEAGAPKTELEQIRAYLHANPTISAILAAESTIALIARKAARELSRPRGGEIEIVCFDDPYSRQYLPAERFTCIKQLELQMGREAVRIVHEHVLGDKGGIEVVSLKASLVQAGVPVVDIST
jgi:GntR family transcriptional regulator, arabinose operon transcriptional repressor